MPELAPIRIGPLMSATYRPEVVGIVVPIPILLFTLSTYSVPLSKLALFWNVETPAILTLSKLVCPSTSRSPLASIAPVNVETPVTPSVFSVVCPETVRPNSVPSDAVSYTHLTLPTILRV